MSMKGKIPHIDLNNFEDKSFENSDYILTSPLSLQACKNLSLKPIELLKSDDNNENSRKLNIKKAREERNKLIEVIKSQSLAVNGKFIRHEENRENSDDESNISRDLSDSRMSGCQSENTFPNPHNYPKNSYIKEITFQQKRRELQQLEKEDKNELKKNIEMKLSRAERNRQLIQQKKYREIDDKREQFENKVKNVSARRRRLDVEIQNYNRELEKFQKLSLKTAAVKSSQKLHQDLERIQSEREQKEQMIRFKRQLLDEETEIRTQDLMCKIVERDRQDEDFMKRKLEKMMESRCYANEAQKLRQELRTVYGLDSFDKKVNYVEAINRVLK